MIAHPPTAADVADYIGGADSSQLWGIQTALDGELSAQARVCRVEPYTADLFEAACRRVAVNIARRNVPLGVQMTDVGGTRIATYDPEVRRLEAPYRKLPVG